MIIFILLTVFALFYIAMIASLFKSEGFFNNRLNIGYSYFDNVNILLFCRCEFC